MNKKKRNFSVIFICIIIVLMIIYYLYSKNETGFATIFIAIFLVLIGYLVHGVLTNKNEKEMFYSNVNRIMKNYSALLVESSIPSFIGKDIIFVKNIDNLANAAIQLRKPILFIKDKESCAFIVLDDMTMLVNIFKINNASDNRVENIINEMNGIFKYADEEEETLDDAIFDENLKKDDAFKDKTKESKSKNVELTKDDAFADKTRDDAFKDRTLKKKETKESKKDLTKDDAFADKTRDDAFKDRTKKEIKKVENKKEEPKVEEIKKKKKKKKKKNKSNVE